MDWCRVLPSAWNRRVLTFRDFDRFCRQSGVRVFELPIITEGLYLVYNRVPLILLSPNLAGIKKIFVAYHELAHHWLHHPGQQFSWGIESKIDFEANLVAACALIPCPVLQSRSNAEIQWRFGYPMELIRFRREVYETWRI